MATGFTQRFQGKIKCAQLWIGSGGMVDAKSGIVGKVDYRQFLSLPVTATANTDYTMSLPTGALIMSAVVYTTVAYLAATDMKIQIGNAAADSSYVAATSVKALAVVPLTLANTAAAALASMPAGTPNLFIRMVQTGTASATGAATLVISYITP